MDGLPDETTKRFVAILNKKIEIGKPMNALGHMTAGFAGGGAVTREEMCFLRFKDKDGGAHPNISHFPFIVLQAENSNQIRTFRATLLEKGIPFTDFTSSMTVGTSAAQIEATSKTAEAELEYFGICMFGETAILKELIKKFSLFR